MSDELVDISDNDDTTNLDAVDIAMCEDAAKRIELQYAQEKLVSLAAGSPLDRSPKSNWIERENGLPKAIEDLAVELTKKGKSVSHAIAIAVSRAKKWAATSKDPKVKAKWGAAVAEWEAKKARSKAKTAAKHASK